MGYTQLQGFYNYLDELYMLMIIMILMHVLSKEVFFLLLAALYVNTIQRMKIWLDQYSNQWWDDCQSSIKKQKQEDDYDHRDISAWVPIRRIKVVLLLFLFPTWEQRQELSLRYFYFLSVRPLNTMNTMQHSCKPAFSHKMRAFSEPNRPFERLGMLLSLIKLNCGTCNRYIFCTNYMFTVPPKVCRKSTRWAGIYVIRLIIHFNVRVWLWLRFKVYRLLNVIILIPC